MSETWNYSLTSLGYPGRIWTDVLGTPNFGSLTTFNCTIAQLTYTYTPDLLPKRFEAHPELINYDPIVTHHFSDIVGRPISKVVYYSEKIY
jgi:hypothetical protein